MPMCVRRLEEGYLPHTSTHPQLSSVHTSPILHKEP